MPMDEDLQILDGKVKQLKREYDQYFLGSRKREPNQLRGEVNKVIAVFSNQAIQNTAHRFRFNSINSRFQALKRQWDNVLRQIEAGTYERHRFKADLHQRARGGEAGAPKRRGGSKTGGKGALFDDYVKALRKCGQQASNVTPEKLAAVVKKQEAALRQRYGVSKVSFRVVVEDGKAKLKASPVRDSS